MNGPKGHSQTPGKVAAGETSMCLEEEESGKEAVRFQFFRSSLRIMT
jgi:hypothetical protein